MVLDAERIPAEELIYGGLQDARTLARWRELLWFYTEWLEKRSA